MLNSDFNTTLKDPRKKQEQRVKEAKRHTIANAGGPGRMSNLVEPDEDELMLALPSKNADGNNMLKKINEKRQSSIMGTDALGEVKLNKKDTVVTSKTGHSMRSKKKKQKID